MLLCCFIVPQGIVPSVVVGVVGIGHVEGITANWDKEIDVKELLRYAETYVVVVVFQFPCTCSAFTKLS